MHPCIAASDSIHQKQTALSRRKEDHAEGRHSLALNTMLQMNLGKVKQGKMRKGLLKRRSSKNRVIFFADDLIQLLGTGFSTTSISLSSINPNPSKVKTQALVLHGYSVVI